MGVGGAYLRYFPHFQRNKYVLSPQGNFFVTQNIPLYYVEEILCRTSNIIPAIVDTS